MQLKSTLLAATVLLAPLCLGGPALAQMYPGEDVTVGPAAGGQVLLYPGGKYQRVLPPLLQPGAAYPNMALPPIHLHKPYRHRIVHAAPAATNVASAAPSDAATQQENASESAAPPAPAASPDNAAAQAAPSAAAPSTGSAWRRKHGARQQVATTTPDAGAAIPFSMDPDALPIAAPPPAQATPASPPPPSRATANPPPAPKITPKSSPPPAPATQPVREASLEKSQSGDQSNLRKRGAVLFEKGQPDPVPAQYHGVQLLAGDLNSALASGAARIQLEAYGGAPGDKSSDARRLSLKRALAVRQLLIDDGVPSSRIDVRAMGGADDNGAPDRVDVFVRSG